MGVNEHYTKRLCLSLTLGNVLRALSKKSELVFQIDFPISIVFHDQCDREAIVNDPIILLSD